MTYMQYYVSLFSSLMYWWLNSVLSLGFKKHLELSDLGVVPEQHEAEYNHERFRKAFIQESVSMGVDEYEGMDRNEVEL